MCSQVYCLIDKTQLLFGYVRRRYQDNHAHVNVHQAVINFNCLCYTAISVNVVGLKLQAFESRPNGGMGIYWNLHISVEEIY